MNCFCFNDVSDLNWALVLKFPIWGRSVIFFFLTGRDACWLSKSYQRTQKTSHCFLMLFFRVLQLNLWVCLWHLCSKLLTSTLPYVTTCATNTEMILCSVSSPRIWGPSFVDVHALSVAVICAFSVLHSPCSHCPSQIPSWRLRSPSLLMLWAAIPLLQKWILVEMPWVIWEQRCWQKLYR